ncbi:MAG: TolC family protein [Candidatus Riflebacteria bacterium]|nr:TolC family protein [Candidatus Riflebacteria bacterium]
MKLVKLCIVLILLFNSIAILGSEETQIKKWSLSECLQYGLENHPLIRISESSITSENALLNQTRAYWDPKVDLHANWNHRKTYTSGVIDDVVDSTSESVGVNKVLYDSGQNRFDVSSVKSLIKSAESRRENTLLEVAAGIKKAFYAVQQAQALILVQEETLDGYQKHLAKVETYVEVGTKTPYDITRAKVDIANSQVELISAKSQLKVAKANLAKAIGLEAELDIADFELAELPQFEAVREDLKQEAFSRPELKSAGFEIDSADAKIMSLKRSLKPTIAASADYSWSGTNTPLDRQWTAGVSLNWSLFDGALTRSKVDGAKSQLVSARENLRNLRLAVNTELENALTSLKDALERHNATGVLVQQASESLSLAEGRYDAGVGNPIEINDARVEYARARGNFVVAHFDSLIASAEVERVAGRLPDEYKIQAMEPLKPAPELSSGVK